MLPFMLENQQFDVRYMCLFIVKLNHQFTANEVQYFPIVTALIIIYTYFSCFVVQKRLNDLKWIMYLLHPYQI